MGYILLMDKLTNELFPPIVLEMFGVTTESISNHLAAIIQNKDLQEELESMM